MQNISGNLIEILSRLAFPKIGIIDIIQIARARRRNTVANENEKFLGVPDARRKP